MLASPKGGFGSPLVYIDFKLPPQRQAVLHFCASFLCANSYKAMLVGEALSSPGIEMLAKNASACV